MQVKLEDPGYRTETERVQAEGATSLKATIGMGAGVLKVRGDSTNLMDAGFEYSDTRWKPEVSYEVTDGQGELNVKSPESISFTPSRHTRYVWDLALANGLPLDLSVNMGAGEATLDLRGTDLRNLKVNLGAGESTIDLSGDWANDVSADIQAGAGQLVLRVPANVGVRIEGFKDGLGTYSANGFTQDGDALVNDAWETASVKFDIALRRGLGDVRIVTVD